MLNQYIAFEQEQNGFQTANDWQNQCVTINQNLKAEPNGELFALAKFDALIGADAHPELIKNKTY